jgi:hypothetical protein
MAKTKTRENAEKQALIIIFIALFTKSLQVRAPVGVVAVLIKVKDLFSFVIFLF